MARLPRLVPTKKEQFDQAFRLAGWMWGEELDGERGRGMAAQSWVRTPCEWMVVGGFLGKHGFYKDKHFV